MVITGGDSNDLSVCHCDLPMKRGKTQMLLVFFGVLIATCKHEDQRIFALEFALPSQCAMWSGS